MAEEYDLVTIGAGSGGVRASRFAAAQYGKKVAVIELPFGFVSSDRVGGAGGTCVIRGCVPKKLFVYGSEFAEHFEDARGFGWDSSRPAFDFQKLMSAKNKEITRLNGVYDSILGNANVEMIEGRGRIVDKNTVEVELNSGDVKTLKTKNILVATGGQAVILNVPGAKEYGMTSDHALALDELPKRIAIMGAGYIAVEFAGIFAGMGVETHLFFRKPLPLTGFDEECRQQVLDNLKARGIHTHPYCSVTKVEKVDGGLVFSYANTAGEDGSVTVDRVMFATGRKPNVEAIGLENLGIKQARNGAIIVDEYSRTNVEGVWAIGDVTDRMNLTPVALMEGMAFAHSAFGPSLKKPDHENVPSAVFCQPPLGSVGLTEEQAVAQLSGTIDVYASKFRPMRNTLSGRDERTLMKLLVHRESDRVVGVHMVGEAAAEIMQGIAIAVKGGATKAQFDSTVGIHPSSAEEFVTMRSVTRSHAGQGTRTP